MVEYGDRVFVDCTCDRIHCLLHFVNLHFKVADPPSEASNRVLDIIKSPFNTAKSPFNIVETLFDPRKTGLDGFSQVLYGTHDASKGRLGFFPLLLGVLHASKYIRTPNDAITPLQAIRP